MSEPKTQTSKIAQSLNAAKELAQKLEDELKNQVERRTAKWVNKEHCDYNGSRRWTELELTPSGTETQDADAIVSLTEDGMHAPVLDIDFHAELRPSKTEGHFHLLLDKKMTGRQYKRLLKELARCGIIEPGYRKQSVSRGWSAVSYRQPRKDTGFGHEPPF